MGEFGAVSVVSGNIRGQTNTLPLHIELLYHDYNAVGAFAAASILAALAVVTLIAKVALERRGAGRRAPPVACRHSAEHTGDHTVKIRLDTVVKTFDTFRAVHGVSLDIESGELVALLGPSGSGKTTILRMVAGLEFPDGGAIYFGDENATDIEVRHRGVGFVFQHYALFPHMTVGENIAFGMKVSKTKRSGAEISERVAHLLRLVQLEGLQDRFPAQISGGQRQRVALARALAVDPKVLLLDEPFGALDANVRRDLRRWLRKIHDELGITHAVRHP